MVGVRELKNIQENIFRLEQQVHVRKVLGTSAEKFSGQFQECFQKVELSVDCLGLFDDSLSALNGLVPRPRSSIWKGLRFTLSDSILFQTRVVPNENVEDDQVQAMVQGPFFWGCLK